MSWAKCAGGTAPLEGGGKHGAWVPLVGAQPRPLRWSPIWAGLLAGLYPVCSLTLPFSSGYASALFHHPEYRSITPADLPALRLPALVYLVHCCQHYFSKIQT